MGRALPSGAPVDRRRPDAALEHICVALIVLVARWSRNESAVTMDLTARARSMLLAVSSENEVFDGLQRFRISVDIEAQASLTSLVARLRDALNAPHALPADADRSPVLLDAGPANAATCRADVTLTVAPSDMCAAVVVQGDASLFRASTVTRLADALQMLHAAATADVSGAMLEMELVPPSDRALLLDQWSTVTEPRVGTQLTHRLFEARAQVSPHAVALSFGDRVLTYRALNAQANGLAAELVAQGIGAGDIVGVVAPRSPELVVALLAILKTGAAFLPIDPVLPHDRIRFMLQDTRCRLVLMHPALRSRLNGIADGLHTRLTMIAAPQHDSAGPERADLPDGCTPDAPVYVLYTSGSTGRPKGVVVPHRALCNHSLWFAHRVGMTATDRVLQHASIAFDAAMAELFAPLIAGATVVLAQAEIGHDLRALPSVIRRERISVVQMVPSALRVVVSEPDFARCISLRYLVSGGEVLDGALAAAVRRCLPSLRIGNFYGPTETTVDATAYELPGDIEETSPLPIGVPVANTTVYVLDSRQRLTPIGMPGELYVGGVGLALGYVNATEMAAANFVADPFTPGARLYRTGDLVRWRQDANLEYLGRIDAQVKLRGYRIELGEVEALLGEHPGIAHAVVTLRDDATDGPQLVAYVVRRVGVSVTVAALRTTLSRQLPAYMVPSVFCFLDALPLLVNGKIDRRALPTPMPHRTAQHDPVSDSLETSLQRIWEQTLGVSPIDIDSDFFELGGHSLSAIRLLVEIERAHGFALRAPILFESPTIRTLANRLRERTPRETSTIVPVQSKGSRTPIFFAPGGGGELFVFDALARALGADQPFFALDMYVFDELKLNEEPVTLQAIARRMLQDLRAIQPTGPYQLAGYSLGGNLVLEIAQQLRADGETVALLALLDCNAPGYPHRQPFLTRTLSHVQQAFALQDGSARYLGDRALSVARAIFRPAPYEVKLYADQDEAQFIPAHVLETLEQSLTPVLRAWEAYTARYYGGPVLLIRASVRMNLVGIVDDDPYLGWGSIVGGALRLEEMPCDHSEIVRPEFAVRLASILSRHLHRVATDEPGVPAPARHVRERRRHSRA